MDVGPLVGTILVFVALVLVGVALRGAKVLRPEDARVLNGVIIYVGLPAFVFEAVHGADISPRLAGVVAVSWGVFAITALLAWLAARALHLPPRAAGAFILTSALGNTGYIGYPATAALLGRAAVPDAVFYDVVGTVFALVVIGLPIARHFGSESRGSRSNPLSEIITFPAVIALAIALLLRPVVVPELVSRGIELCANLVAPLVMLSVGVSLRPGHASRVPVALGLQSVLKLLVAPLAAFGLASLALRSGGVPAQVAVLEASMPAMMLSLPIGSRFGLDTDFIASAIFISTALAVVTIPAIQVVAFG